MVQQKRMRIFLWAAVVIWMAAIFCLSAQAASESSSLSGSTVKIVIEHTQPGFRELPTYKQNIIVTNYQPVARKTAHMLVYTLLGILTMSALFQHSITKGRRFAAAFVICVLYAGTDEIHQIFISGRSGQIGDVCIDAGGAILGICAVVLILRIVRKRAARGQIAR